MSKLSEEEKQTIEYLKARLYGNEGCKIIDVAQSDLRIFLKLVENLQKDIERWKNYCNEQENDITLKNNKICDLEFKIEKQSKEIEELEESILAHQGLLDLYNKEKEKREIAEKNHKVLSLDLGQALNDLGLPEDTIIADELVLEINKKYISKDKIKEFKNKFIEDSKDEKVFMTQSSQINASLISFCNELLEE